MTIKQQFEDFIDARTNSVSHYPQVEEIIVDVKRAVSDAVDTLVEGIYLAAADANLADDLVESFLIESGLVEPSIEESVDEETDQAAINSALLGSIQAITEQVQAINDKVDAAIARYGL